MPSDRKSSTRLGVRKKDQIDEHWMRGTHGQQREGQRGSVLSLMLETEKGTRGASIQTNGDVQSNFRFAATKETSHGNGPIADGPAFLINFQHVALASGRLALFRQTVSVLNSSLCSFPFCFAEKGTVCNLDVFGTIWLLAIGVNFLTYVSNTEVFVYFIKEEDLFIKITRW